MKTEQQITAKLQYMQDHLRLGNIKKFSYWIDALEWVLDQNEFEEFQDDNYKSPYIELRVKINREDLSDEIQSDLAYMVRAALTDRFRVSDILVQKVNKSLREENEDGEFKQ